MICPVLFLIAGKEWLVVDLGEVVMILGLHRQGLSVSEIARRVRLDRKTARTLPRPTLSVAVRMFSEMPRRGCSAQNTERMVVRVEQHLMRLKDIRAHEEGAARGCN